MTFKHFKGDFDTLEEVWKRYPSGGLEGDYLNVDGQILRWNDIEKQWTAPDMIVPPSSRNTESVFSDLSVENDLSVGGILRARVVRGRSASCGLFVDEAALLKHYPKPLVGQWALVMIEERTDADGNAIGEVYYCQQDGQWEDAGFRGGFDGEYDAILTEKEERKEGDAALYRALQREVTSLSGQDEKIQKDTNELFSVLKRQMTHQKNECFAMFNKLWSVLDEMTKEHNNGISVVTELKYFVEGDAMMGITVNSIRLNAMSHVAIYINNEVIAEASDVATFTTDYLVSETSTLLCVAVIDGKEYREERTINRFDNFFLGAGNNYEDVMKDATSIPANNDANNSYDIVCRQGNHIYLVIDSAKDGCILRADMNGFEIPFSVSYVTVRGKEYAVFESDNVYEAGMYNIDLSVDFPPEPEPEPEPEEEYFFLGTGKRYEDAVDNGIRILADDEASKEYDITCLQGDHIYVIINKAKEKLFRRAEMNAFEIPFTVSYAMIRGKEYAVFESDNIYEAGEYSIAITYDSQRDN